MMIVQASLGIAQTQNSTYTLQARIVEEGTNEALPFVTVYNKNKNTGTASNLEGYFKLPNNQLGDTIVVTFLGYKEILFAISESLPEEIILSPNSSLLSEVIVTAESDFLYELVANVRNHKSTKHKTSKTYLFLESLLYNEPVEIIEAYYNGTYSDHGINTLKIKKGRIGLKKVNDRYYISTESSNLFSMHNVFAKSHLFPESPLAINKKELKSNYTLTLNQTFEEDQSIIYVVDIVPKEERNDLFSSTVWIDRNNNRLVKVSLWVKNASVHPFIPIGYNTIQGVDMEINKSYQTIDGEAFINTIDFNYNISYVDQSGIELKATTRAFTKAYDYNTQFKLPLFEFTRHLHEDYRNITVVPYDSAFWNQTTEFRFYDRLAEIEKFITENKIDHSVFHPENKKDSLHSQLQFAYIPWDETRFKMGPAREEVIEKYMRTQTFEIDRYYLNIKLFLDVNFTEDSFLYQLNAILDPVGSYYYFHIANPDLAFMNMYFDLMEIEKNELEIELEELVSPDEKVVERLYQKHLKQFEESRRRLVSETDRGQNMVSMEKWNNYILQALDVNNLAAFDLINTE